MSVEKFKEFADLVISRISVNSSYADKCMVNIRPSLVWTAKQMEGGAPEPCELLLKGCYGAAVEAISLVSFGLVRPAVLSLRSHYELTLQYLFYKDHPVEWRNVKEFRSEPKLPGVNKKYLRDNFPKFEGRFKKLLNVKNRSTSDCYEVLSGIAHGTAINSISSATNPVDLVETEQVISQSVTVFHDVGEYLCDIYVSSFESNWLSLPELTRKLLATRFGEKNPRIELDL